MDCIHSPMRSLKIAMVGLKGLPAKWGGIEKFVEEVGRRLVERGHQVTVFGSRWYCGERARSRHLGMRLKVLPSIPVQAADALSRALLAALPLAATGYDVIHFHGFASYFLVPLVRLAGTKTIVTAHGVESGWNNPKYPSPARSIIRTAFKIGMRESDCVTTVAEHLREQILLNYRRDARVLRSGIEVSPGPAPCRITEKYGLNGNDFVLFLGRIDPIKRVDWIVELGRYLPSHLRVVIAGGAQDERTRHYSRQLTALSGDTGRVIFTGPVEGREKAELLSNCLLFLQPSLNEGFPITLLEAAAYGRCCVASAIPAHREILEDGMSGWLFPVAQQSCFHSMVLKVLRDQSRHIDPLGVRARQVVGERFNWRETTGLLEELYRQLLR